MNTDVKKIMTDREKSLEYFETGRYMVSCNCLFYRDIPGGELQHFECGGDDRENTSREVADSIWRR